MVRDPDIRSTRSRMLTNPKPRPTFSFLKSKPIPLSTIDRWMASAMLPNLHPSPLRMGMLSRVANGFLCNPVETDGHLRTRRPHLRFNFEPHSKLLMPAEFSAVAA